MLGRFSSISSSLKSVNFEMSFWCLQIDQKTNDIFVRISALASKKRFDQKSSVTVKVKSSNWWYEVPFNFLI